MMISAPTPPTTPPTIAPVLLLPPLPEVEFELVEPDELELVDVALPDSHDSTMGESQEEGYWPFAEIYCLTTVGV